MPIYEYQCVNCGYTIEVLQPISSSYRRKIKIICERCGKKSFNRVISNIGGIIFKGSGFYATDYDANKKDK